MVASGAVLLSTPAQTLTSRVLRQALGALFRPTATPLVAAQGALAGPAGTQGELTLLTDLLCRVNPGVFVINGTHNAKQGQYIVPNDELVDLAVPAKDAAQSRRAYIAVRVADSTEAGLAPGPATDIPGVVEVQSGALAAANPALPAVTANTLYLGELTIPSTASGLPVTITKYETRTVLRGQRLPVATEAAALALPAASLWPGFEVFTDDTRARGVWTGTGWVWYDTQWQTYVPRIAHGSVAGYWTPGNSAIFGRFWRNGRQVNVEGDITLGSTAAFGGTPTSNMYITLPAACYPAQWTAQTIPMGVCWIANGASVFGYVAQLPSVGVPADRRLVFYNTTAAAVTGSASGAGTWTIYSAGHGIRWQATYETAYE